MDKIVNLTHTITDKMAGYPGDPVAAFKQVHTIKKIGYNVTEVSLGTHSGTHLDVPCHCIPGGRTVDNIDLTKCIGPAQVIKLNKKSNSLITVTDLIKYNFKSGDRILIKTGWAERFGTVGFFKNFPGISIELAEYLGKIGISLLGLEQPSVNPVDHLQVHKLLLSKGIVIVESMNLTTLKTGKIYLVVIPLQLKGLDGTPVGAVAF